MTKPNFPEYDYLCETNNLEALKREVFEKIATVSAQTTDIDYGKMELVADMAKSYAQLVMAKCAVKKLEM